MSLIFDSACFKIITLFSLSPGSRFRRKEIKEKTRLNNMPLDSGLLKMMSAEVLKKDDSLYSLNLENESTKAIVSLASHNFKKMKELPLDVYFFLTDLMVHISPKNTEIYLFGSYAKLVYSDKSDVDIAFLFSKPPDKKSIEKAVRKLEKTYKKAVEMHYFDKKAFYKNRKDPLVKDILRNGIRLI